MPLNDEVIALDSASETDESDGGFQDPNTATSTDGKSQVIEISSDEEVIEPTKSEANVVCLRSESPASVQEVQEEPEELTPQQLMRNKLAEAAERRLLHLNETEENVNPTKRRKVDPAVAAKKVDSKNHTKLANASIDDRSSRIRLISNPSYCDEFGVYGDKDTVSLSDMVGSKDLVQTYQFNMLIDFDYLSRFVTSNDCSFTLVTKYDDDHVHVKDRSWENNSIRIVDVSAKLPKYGTHHTKMMVNFYRDKTCRIILHTMNLTEADHKIQTQMCWMSPQLTMHTDVNDWFDFNQPNISLVNDTGLAFKRDFIAYLLTYENSDINKLIDQVAKYDFNPIDVVFVASSPGHYLFSEWNQLIKPTSKPMFGYGRLWQVVHILKLQSLMGKFIGQVSTIAGPCDNWKRNVFVHVLTSCVEKGYPISKKADYEYVANKNHVQPIIIWPTVTEILKSYGAPLSGVALHLTSRGKWPAFERQFQEIKKYFYRWSSSNDPTLSSSGRSNLAPHVKTYTVTEDNFKTLKWFLMTSANISHQAWGKPKGYKTIEYDICSFEAGILVAPQLLKVSSNVDNKNQVLVPTYGKDSVENEQSLSNNICKIGLRLPYDTPLEKYTATDIAWSQPDSDQFF